MDYTVRLAFAEGSALRLLNWLAAENARMIRALDERALLRGESGIPGIYESGVVYRPEAEEIWSDALMTMVEGHEDCDALAAWRAGELLARGAAALRPHDPRDPVRYPGDGGFEEAMAQGLPSIPAEVYLSTNGEKFDTNLYHCVVRYNVGGRWYADDPSARLGMLSLGSPEAAQGLVPAHIIEAARVARAFQQRRRGPWRRRRRAA